ncbi:HAMP domain-containing sensor histidine kinase [Micromonospora chokoriensis]|uniref:histidine kinase n=1 Tax=Micromonospora chokoriensis TaxID=356851 RepID=A0A1C4ZB12_9ACTN|nr:HAMP domain-containing sensor histidine kinase [Micromonospora chokoriensis]SCF30202.1 two-component system, OmpR family, sensor histidine kinase BaeS [Micromonospora chokoriensis]
MAREVPLRRSLLLRLLALAVLIAVGSIAATAWLAVRTTAGAIRQEQGQALADDARIYDTLLAYAATHPSWDGVDAAVQPLARDVGRRIALTTETGALIADSAPGSGPLPTTSSATVDALAVDTTLMPGSSPPGGGAGGMGRIDPRAGGPYLLPPEERATLRGRATEAVRCLRLRARIDAVVVDGPTGRPRIDTPGTDLADTAACAQSRSALATPTATENRALAQLNALVNTCLARRRMSAVQVDLNWTWTRQPAASAPDAPPTEGIDQEHNRAISACVGTSRREQLLPYVAPAATLFVSDPGGRPSSTFDLSPANQTRIVAVAGLVLLVTVGVTVLAGIRLTRPLHALTGAAQRMRDGDGSARVRVTGRDEIARLAEAFNDMAERRERLEQLRRAMVSDIAHEMRTPVSNIRGWLEAVEDGLAAPDHRLHSSLLEEATLLQHVIADLQDLAEADAGALRLHREQVYLDDLLAQVAEAHRVQADRVGVTVAVRTEADPQVDADPVRLRQVVGNLVANAVRHTPSGGHVTISARATDTEAVVSVTDTGSGISAEDLPRVFDRFWRAEKSRSRQTGGSGLGLAIVRQLIEAHGGTVTATSVPSHGSTFTLRLPHHDPTPPPRTR